MTGKNPGYYAQRDAVRSYLLQCLTEMKEYQGDKKPAPPQRIVELIRKALAAAEDYACLVEKEDGTSETYDDVMRELGYGPEVGAAA